MINRLTVLSALIILTIVPSCSERTCSYADLNLNGEWDFAFDFGRSGRARGMAENGEFPEKILVPFAPESKLSGIEYVDFIPAVWYRRTFTLPASFVKGDSRLLLRFGAVDYETEVWINGVSAGDRVAIVDDVVSTGGTLEATIGALRSEGVQVTEVVVVFDKSDDLESISERLGVPIRSLLSIAVVDGVPTIR